MEWLQNLLIVVGVIILLMILLLVIKHYYDRYAGNVEDAEVQKSLEKIKQKVTGEDPNVNQDVLEKMNRNISQMEDYYTVTKRQARQTYSAAMIACILGFIIYLGGIYLSRDPDSGGVSLVSSIGGSIVEVISGLFFWLYSKASEQMKVYYDGLRETENYLSSLSVAEKMAPENRDSAYAYIITKMMDKGQTGTIVLSQGE